MELAGDRLRSTRQRGPRLSELGTFEGDADLFWPAYLEAVGTALGARRMLVLAQVG